MKRGELIQAIEKLHIAIKQVEETWKVGDLAGAVRNLIETDEQYAVPAIEWWESDE